MTIQLRDLEISTSLPDVEDSMPVFISRARSLEERRPAIKLLRDALDLGRLQALEVRESIHFFSERGEIQYYRPSGALWAINNALSATYEDERRSWKVTAIEDPNDREHPKLELDPVEQRRLSEYAAELLRGAELLSEQAYFAGVDLEQVFQLDEHGSEVDRFAGEATVRHLYRAGETPFDGPGAKSYAFANPGDEQPQLVGVFHCWREVQDSRDIQMITAEQALEVGLASDPELELYQSKKYRFALTDVRLVYYTMAPFKYQEFVFPALHVVGSAIPEEDPLDGFEFTRFYHAAPPASYAEAGLYALYLSCRP